MTGRERLWTGLAVSLFAHFLLLSWGGREEPPQGAFNAAVYLDLESSAAGPAPGRGLGLSSPSKQAQEAARLADMKRRAFLRFLEEVDNAVHARRLTPDSTHLIGVAECSFLILPDGRFSEPTLRASSGRADLDTAALRAVRAASGVIRRPALLGTEPIPLTLPVKYQYGLR